MNKHLIRIIIGAIFFVASSCYSVNHDKPDEFLKHGDKESSESKIRQSITLKFAALDNQNNELSIELVLHFNLPEHEVLTEKDRTEIIIVSQQVLKKYNYQEIYEIKRYEIELQIEESLKKHFNGKYLEFLIIELSDVSLPESLLNKMKMESKTKNGN